MHLTGLRLTRVLSNLLRKQPSRIQLAGSTVKKSFDLDLAKYRAVSIWCKRFSVGAAALHRTETSPAH